MNERKSRYSKMLLNEDVERKVDVLFNQESGKSYLRKVC